MFPRFGTGFGAFSLALFSGAASFAANSFSDTPLGAMTGGQPVSARATFTTTPGQVVILLENFKADPRSVVQALSGLSFELDGNQIGGSLTGSSALERSIANNGTFADLGSSDTGWSYANNELNVLGTPVGPEHLLIGPPAGNNLYGDANGSIAGNGPHNPFLALSATFTLSIPSVSANTVVTDTVFMFGTSAGNDVPGVPFIPEPAGLSLLALSLPLLRRRAKSS